MNEHDEPTQRRATMLPLMLGSILAFFFAVFLVLITGGFFIYVLLAWAGILLLGAFHWFAWGKLLTEQTAGEREEAELLDRARATDAEAKWTHTDTKDKYRR